MTPPVRWAPVPGYEGFYEVSSAGSVRSCTRTVRDCRVGQKVIRGRVKTPQHCRDGYSWVVLHRDGRPRSFRVSRLVLSAFVRQPGPQEEACHKNHDRTDNCLDNLCWGSRQDNENQKTASGRRPRSTRGLLDQEAATAMRRRAAAGEPAKALAAAFRTHLSNVYLVLGGKTWAP